MQEHGEADEARIAALFRDAASGAPPPAFDAAQVVATSRRITRRRRSAVAGAALAVLAVVGVGVVAGIDGPRTATVTAASGQAADQAAPGAGAVGYAARAAAPQVTEAAAAPNAAVPPAGPPLGPGTRQCADRHDLVLRTLVEQVLPEVVGASEAATTMECRPGGVRCVSVQAGDRVLVVTYLPSGTVTELPD